jgi:serine/threonine protein kinase
MNCAELFRLWQTDALAAEAKGRKKKRLSPTQQNRQLPEQLQQSPTDLSPQRFAFSRLGLEAGAQLPQQPLQNNQLPNQPSDQYHTDSKLQKHQGLSSVMESNSLTSSGSLSRRDDDASLKSKSSMTSSIATKSSINAGNISLASLRTLPQGKCLTQPSIPIANDNLDNSEGNIIAFENDIISISRKQVHVLTKDKMQNTSGADFRIQSLLGQGTFAQVFRCLHLQTGKLVAVKIVKNKPAYTRQAAVEIDVFRALTSTGGEKPQTTQGSGSPGASGAGVNSQSGETKWDYMVDLVCYFMHKSHLCLVFELLGLNLYEVLKRRQFRGLPLPVVRTLVRQAVGGIKELSQKSIVHCDLKPENILLVTEDDVDSVVAAGDRLSSPMEKKSSIPPAMEKRKGNMGDSLAKPDGLSQALCGDSSTQTSETAPISPTGASATGAPAASANVQPVPDGLKIKLIDFGSACFEGQTAHTYIQSRFYRSPEVLIGMPYDSAIDMWSLGCVAAELFLGLPILPGAHEHDQLGRICEMIAKVPDSMLDQGSKASKYFVKYVPRGNEGGHTPTPPPQTPPPSGHGVPTPRPLPQWRIRTQQEYIASLSQSEIRKKGGLAKLEKQPTNRYFKRKQLADIIMHKGQNASADEKELLELFVHFLYGKFDCWEMCEDPMASTITHRV